MQIQEDKPYDDINITPMLDLAYVLLVIFMITAPIMQGGIDVTLPSTTAKPLTPKGGLTITVTRDKIFVDQTEYSDNGFRAVIKSLADSRGAAETAGLMLAAALGGSSAAPILGDPSACVTSRQPNSTLSPDPANWPRG